MSERPLILVTNDDGLFAPGIRTLVEEMKAVFDPRGGYFKAGGVYMSSLVAELGSIVEDHLKSIGLIHDPEMSAAQRALIAEKRAAYENRGSKKKPEMSQGV